MIEFFRDTLSGIYYWLYVALNLLFIFAIIGYIAEKKEEESSEHNNLNIQSMEE